MGGPGSAATVEIDCQVEHQFQFQMWSGVSLAGTNEVATTSTKVVLAKYLSGRL